MVQFLTILFCIIAICIIGILICEMQLKKCDKHLKELDDISWHLEHGTPLEEIFKMPMPKKLKKEFLKIYEEEKMGKRDGGKNETGALFDDRESF